MKFPWTTSIVDVLNSDSKLEDKLQHVAKSLTKHKEDISKVVEELGPALTHKDPEMRLKGTKFLSDLLHNIPTDLLDENQLNFIVTFYCDRIKDHHSVVPQVVVGLLAIVKMKNFPRSAPVQVLQQLFANVPCQSQVRNDRANIFSLIQSLADNFQPELDAMGADFIYGVIQAFEGERDPRNLVFLFEFMPRFVSSYSLRHLSEEMFETFSCYFPIDFHPNPNDPQAITRDVLAEKLATCLCASKEFAEPCFSLILEKLETESKTAKLDSLNLLTKAADNFNPSSTIEHFDDIWQALKTELLPGSNNKEVVDTALSSVSALVGSFKSDQANQDIVLNKIFTSIIGNLLNRDSKLYKPSLEIAKSCAEGSEGSCVYVANKILPITLTFLTSDDEITEWEKSEVFESLTKFLEILKSRSLIANYNGDNCVLLIQKELVKVLMTPSSPELKKAAWTLMTTISSIVSDENRLVVYKLLNEALKSATPEQVQCLLALANDHPDEVHKLVLSSNLSKTFIDPQEATNVFTTLSELLVVPELRDSIIEVICLAVFNNESKIIQIVVLKVLNAILAKYQKSPEIAKILNAERAILKKLMDLIKKEDPDVTQDVMYHASTAMHLLVQTLPPNQQMELIEEYLPQMKLNESISDLYITSGLLGFLDAAVPVEAHFDHLVNELTKLSLTSEDERVRKIANQLMCSLFNRAPIDDKHRKVLRKIYEILKEELKKSNHKAAELLGWISKGILARGHPDAAEILETLAELLDHPKLSKAAELAFEIISVEYPQLHLPVLKNLFKQKIFVLALKFLEKKIEEFGEHHLTAMAHVLQITPHQVLKMNIDKVGPILIKCIQLKSDDPKPHAKRVLLSLKIINHFIVEKSKYTLDHLQHLVNDFLKLTSSKESMQVRILACNCLENVTVYPLFTLVPYKSDVILGLAEALDDHKRLVRSAAVAARLAWFMLGEEKDEK